MHDWSVLILPVTVAAFALGALVVLTPRLIRPRARLFVDARCNVCQHPLKAFVSEMYTPDPHETGFVVRERPEAYGRPLREMKCPGCGSVHVFAIDRTPPEYLVTNAVSATERLNTCAQCRTPLKRPEWPRGAFDGNVLQAPRLDAKHGLICSRCGAVVCVKCCREASQGRTTDNSLRCPRCFRGPIEKFVHF